MESSSLEKLQRPLASIIMPVYNAEKYLRPAINSCLNQTYPNIEIIVIDDGSTDQTATICAEYEKNVTFKYVKNETNQGLIFSLNRAISLAKGQFIARMDQDDISLPERISMQVDYLITHPNIEVLGSDVILMSDLNTMYGKPRFLLDSESSIEWSIISSCPLHHPTVMFNRSIIDDPTFKQELYDKVQHYAEDLGLWSKILLQNKKMHVLETPLLLYRKHISSMSTVYKAPQMNASIAIARNFALTKWNIKGGEQFLKSMRTRNQLDHDTFFIEANLFLSQLKNKASKELVDTALQDIQSLCFECLHFLVLKRETDRAKAAKNSIKFLISTFHFKITFKALMNFYKGLYRRFIYIKLHQKDHSLFKNISLK